QLLARARVLKGDAAGIARIAVGHDAAHAACGQACIIQCEQRRERGRVDARKPESHGGVLREVACSLHRRTDGYSPLPDTCARAALRAWRSSRPAACARVPAARATTLRAAPARGWRGRSAPAPPPAPRRATPGRRTRAPAPARPASPPIR